jgi:hypothetical protein
MKKWLFLGICISVLFYTSAQYDLSQFSKLESKGDFPKEFSYYLSDTTNKDVKMSFLFSSGLVVYGSEINQYLDNIKDRLLSDFPDMKDQFSIYLYKSTAPNLYSDGKVVMINLGIINKVENESELAFIIAHEIAHILLKHERFKRDRKESVAYYEQDLNNEYHNKTATQELEADEYAIEKLYSKSGYSIKDIDNVFYLWNHIFANYEEQTFERSFFETPYYSFPNSYFLTSTAEMDAPSEEELKEIKNKKPVNLLERTDHFELLKSNYNLNDGTPFIQPEAQFIYIRNLARFESLNVDMIFQNFDDLLYNVAVLIHQFPDNKFVNMICIAAHYDFYMQKMFSNEISILKNYKKVEGAKQYYHFFYNKLSKDELGMLALRYAWQASKVYPENPYFLKISKNIIKNLQEKKKLEYSNYSDYPMNIDVSTIPKDTVSTVTTTSPKGRGSRIKERQSVKIIPTEKFKTLNYMLVDLRKDSLFMVAVENGLKEVEDQEVLSVIDDKRFKGEVDNFVVFNPLNYREKSISLKMEEQNKEIYKTVKQSLKALHNDTKVLSLLDLSQFDTEMYNHYTHIQLYFYNMLHGATFDGIYFQSNHIKPTCDYFNSENFNFILSKYTPKNDRIYKRLYLLPLAAVNPVSAPITLAHMYARSYAISSIFLVVNVLDSKVNYLSALNITDYNGKLIRNQFIYDNYYSIIKKKGSKK